MKTDQPHRSHTFLKTNLDALQAKQNQFSWMRWISIRLLALCALLSVALYNGYPTYFSDTGSYLLTGKFWVAYPPFRAPGYSLFTRAAGFGGTAWFIVAFQAAIVIYLLDQTWKYLLEDNGKLRDWSLLCSACALATMTALPWLVSLLMPDVFAGAVFLSSFLLSFAGGMRIGHRILLAAILAISVAAHLSFLPIALAFIPPAILLSRWNPLPGSGPSAKSSLAWLLVPIFISTVATAEMNRTMNLGFSVSPSRNMFLLSRLFGTGLADDFIRENCPRSPLISCKYLSDLPNNPDQFLFRHPLGRVLAGHPEEVATIVHGALLAHPLRFLVFGARDTFHQLAAFRTGEEIGDSNAQHWTISAIRQVFPRDFPAFSNSRQSREILYDLLETAAPAHNATLWLSLAACLAIAWTDRFERVTNFLCLAVVFLLINAAVSAMSVGVYDRYQCRVAWIIPLCLTAYFGCWAKELKRSEVLEAVPVPEG